MFLLYETDSFLGDITQQLERKGYNSFRIRYLKGIEFTIEEFISSIDEYARDKYFELLFHNDENIEISVSFGINGCVAMSQGKRKDIYNDTWPHYYFFKNKGYYQDTDLFIKTLEKTINSMREG